MKVLAKSDGFPGPKARIFKIFPLKKNWLDARKICRENGGDLAILDTKELNVQAAKIGGFGFWIGGFRKNDQTTWKWVGRGKIRNQDKNWGPKQPNKDDLGEACLIIDHKNDWNDKPCTYENTVFFSKH